MLKSGMGLKKAYCTHCRTSDEKERVFEVNSEAQVCYCPRCMTELVPSEAINAFDTFIDREIKKANTILYSAIHFEKAYSLYAAILDLDRDNVEAHFGRLLSLVYMSTLRRNHFQDFILLLNEEKSLFRLVNNEALYLAFLGRVCRAVDEYYHLFRKKVIIHHYFYDIDCIKIYFKNLSDIHELKSQILKEYLFLKSRQDQPNINHAIDSLEKTIKAQTEEMNKKWLTADGYSYGYVGLSQYGDVLLGRSDKQNAIKIAHYHPRALHQDKVSRNKHLIKDSVYPNNLPMYRLKHFSLPLTICFFLLSAACAIGYFIFQTALLNIVFLAAGVSLLAVSSAFLILYLYSHYKLRKRHRLIS